jgi:branched-chain amino acid transport system substrate-binding protein
MATSTFDERRRQALACLLAAGLPLGCSAPRPVRLGFVAELNDTSSDLARTARNGALLAVQAANEAGSELGPVELVVRDLGGTPADAQRAVEELAQAGVVAAIGAVTSVGTQRLLQAATPRGLLLVSPTASSLDLHGHDDLLFRINGTTRDNGLAYARRCVQKRDLRQIAVARTARNKSFANSWAHEFTSALTSLGGQVVQQVDFDSLSNSLVDVARQLTQLPGVQAIVIIGNAVDAARLTQLLRKQRADLPILVSEWAASEQLLELGGQAVEGVELIQLYDRHDQSARFTRFTQRYEQQFREMPGFGSVGGHDAATVLLDALRRKANAMSLKDALRTQGPFEGLQQSVAFDENGDNRERKPFFVTIRTGKFVPAPGA